VKQTEGAIGYVELAYANQNKLPTAELRNRDGQWVKATLDTVSAAAAKAEIPPDYRVSIADAPRQGRYPIAAFTYLLVYKEQTDPRKGDALVHFLWWAIHDGQKMAAALGLRPGAGAAGEDGGSDAEDDSPSRGKPALADGK